MIGYAVAVIWAGAVLYVAGVLTLPSALRRSGPDEMPGQGREGVTHGCT